MNADKWEEIKTIIARQFEVEDQGQEDLLAETGDGMVKIGEAEFLVFESSALGGRLKLQFGEKAKLEDKKYHYSHRAGTGARVEYKFSDAETVHTFKAFKWDDLADDWKEIDAERFTNN